MQRFNAPEFKNKRIALKAATWNIVTVAVALPRSVRVHLNGECVLELLADALPVAARALDGSDLDALRAASASSLAFDGPWSLDPAAGFTLFGDFASAAGASAKGANDKCLRAGVALRARVAACEVWTEHVAHGAWRCRARGCKRCEPVMGLKPSDNLDGLRDAPDAEDCSFCNTARAPSEEEPQPNPHPDHPGLLIITAGTFEDRVVHFGEARLPPRLRRLVPAVQAMKPDWYELASLLKDNEEIDIAFIDSDKNRTDPRYIWEGSIPLMKLFVKGRAEVEPDPVRGRAARCRRGSSSWRRSAR